MLTNGCSLLIGENIFGHTKAAITPVAIHYFPIDSEFFICRQTF